MTRNQKGVMWLVWAWAIILLGMTGCTVISQDRVFPKLSWYWTKDAQRQREENKLYSQPHTNKPPIAMPPLPQSVPVTTKARTAKAAIPSLPPPPPGLPLLTTPDLRFTGISAASAAVQLSWTNAIHPVQIQASADLKHWTNATAPLPGNNFTLSDWAPVELFYRLKQATNQIDLGKGYYDSLCVSASAGGNTAVITHDFDSVYLTLYRRDKSVSHYTIDEMIVQDVNYGAGYAWADNNRIVIAYVPSYTNRVFVDEFALTPTSISRVSEIITGDDQSRTPDVLAMSDGTVIVCAAQQCGGMEAWMLHRLPTTGVWKDDGKLQIAPCAVGGEPAGYLKLYETPWNHHPGIAGVHDSWGVLQVFEYQYFGINSTIQAVTNFVVASNRRVNDVMLDGLMAVHGEIPPLKVVGDPVSKTVIFSYGNEQRSYIYGTPIGDFSCTQVAVTAMFQTATNYEKRLVFQSSGRVERVDEVQNLNVSNGVPILTYIPLEAGYCTNWPTLSVATRSINGADVSQEIYCQQYNTLYQHRNYCDLIGVRDDSHIIVILGP